MTHDGEPREDELDGLVEDEDVKHELSRERVVRSVQVVCEHDKTGQGGRSGGRVGTKK